MKPSRRHLPSREDFSMRKQLASMRRLCRCLGFAVAIITAVPNLTLAQQVLTPINFGSQNIGTTSGQQTLTFTGMPVLVTVSQAAGTDFTPPNPTCNGT